MEKKKIDLGMVASKVGKGASDLYVKAKEKAVDIMDQDGDGKLDKNDASLAVKAVSDTVRKTVSTVMTTADEQRKKLDEKKYHPIFDSSLEDADFSLPKFIRVCEIDKKRATSDVCQGAIGHIDDFKEYTLVNIYRDKLERFGLSFYPDNSYQFYYVDPRDRDTYIALDEYFDYLKAEQISELQSVALALGAKHFRVTFKEEKKSFSNKEISGSGIAAKVGANVNLDKQEKGFTNVEIAAEMDCMGHEPSRPTLKYLWKDPSVENLINMRMEQPNKVLHHTLSIKLSKSSGIKENDAVKIDTVMKKLKCSGNATMVSEVMNESRRYLEYTIDF